MKTSFLNKKKRAPKALTPFGSLFVLINILYSQILKSQSHIN